MQTTMPQAALPLLHDETGNGPTLVLVPGSRTAPSAWQAAAETLAATHRVVRLRLLAVELAEAGCALPATYTAAAELDALDAALARLADEPVDLVGWSDGAGLVLAHARRHPATVRTLTLVEPPAPPTAKELHALPQLLVMDGGPRLPEALTAHLEGALTR